ncbi:DEAD/DEAH box helicase [Paraburkholderia unamae]|uniref:DEAD/DEAH box helicase n=1 Tax=Paraburkholderia unamae TaxID=219649 RepID=A0ACC6RGP6_9BURK
MLIWKPKKAVLFRLNHPERITSVIPTAKLVKHEGQVLVAVPHRPDETAVLRNLGFAVPPPIKHHYEWSGPYNPYEVQLESATFLSQHTRAYLLNGMGTGKTNTSLWAYDYLRSVRAVRRVLVVAPLSTLERTWADTVFRIFPHLSYAVLHGSAQRRRKLLKAEHDIYIVNHHGLKVIANDLKERNDIDLVIVDELAVFRNNQTDLWKNLNVVLNKQCPRRAWGLTGAPTPNEPTDAWAQCKLINPTHPDLPKYFSGFRERSMNQIDQYTWRAKPTANDEVQKIMQPSIRYSLDDCTDLPESVLIDREVELTDEQKLAYDQMLRKLAAEHANGEITAANQAVKVGKLVQIGCGVAYDAQGDHVTMDCSSRINELIEIIEESEGKVLVFAPFTGVIEHIAAELRKRWEIGVVHGGVGKDARDLIFRRFQDKQDPMHVIVANPGTMSHGLTLTAATTTCWYAPINSADTYTQANARVRRPGQTKASLIVRMSASPAERKIYGRLDGKIEMQDLLLDLIKEQELVE